MSVVTIGGQPREIRLSIEDIDAAEQLMLKTGRRSVLEVLGTHGAMFTKREVDCLLWGAWRRTLSPERITAVLAQYFVEGGTFPVLHSAVSDALIESGFYGRPERPTEDPPGATSPEPAGRG